MTGGTGGTEASGERSVAAGGGIGRVNTGDFVTQVERATLLPPEALTVSPTGLVHLPERTQLFVGRTRELALLDEGSGIQVLCGLGGIGKSTLAARWAADRVADHTVVWWITAETPAELDAGLAELARAMQPSVVGVLPEDALRERALQWLGTHEGWLLVLDNVSDPADLRPLLARAGGGGRILVTSRRASGWQDIARTVALEVLGQGEAAELFTGFCDADDGLDALCAELGYLPLALKQAAAYCAEAGITPRTYRELLAAYPAEMFAATSEGGEAARTLARVWQVTLDRLADTPTAVSLLRVIAWWAPEGIPRWLLEPLGTPLEVTEAVRRLAAHSMITLRNGELTVHRLVQAVVRADPATVTVTARDAATRLLRMGAWHEVDGAGRRVAVHAEALAGHSDQADDTEDAARLFELAALFFRLDTVGARALPLAERALNSMRRIHGPDHPDTLRAVQYLALALEMEGSKARAVELLADGLAARLRLLGPDDPATLEAREGLARVLREFEPTRAEELLAENAVHFHRLLGPRHPSTIQARYELLEASSRGALDVVPLEELVTEAEHASPQDPDVEARIKRSLALALAAAGETERALALAENVIEDVRRRDGDADANTFLSRLIVVHVLMLGGQEDRGRALGAELLEDCLRTVGECDLTRLVRQQMELE
ncbi:tetratricopeptide repeat protein [Streptomyces sp. NPDC050848]|uniref:tetratricopeptide repeat protein n=1 Tax=Streptomyces sp. NPDC050848 TaxID=3155791 RepID=UPI0034071588